jgi:hypothetical protein
MANTNAALFAGATPWFESETDFSSIGQVDCRRTIANLLNTRSILSIHGTAPGHQAGASAGVPHLKQRTH